MRMKIIEQKARKMMEIIIKINPRNLAKSKGIQKETTKMKTSPPAKHFYIQQTL